MLRRTMTHKLTDSTNITTKRIPRDRQITFGNHPCDHRCHWFGRNRSELTNTAPKGTRLSQRRSNIKTSATDRQPRMSKAEDQNGNNDTASPTNPKEDDNDTLSTSSTSNTEESTDTEGERQSDIWIFVYPVMNIIISNPPLLSLNTIDQTHKNWPRDMVSW